MTTTPLDIDAIRIDGETQPRLCLDEPTVAAYAADLTAGAVFPPVTVFFDGKMYWLADGFHRYHAYRRNGAKTIDALVAPGTRTDAAWAAAGANTTHGLRRTNADKAYAVRMALSIRPEDSDRAIAAHVGVSDKTVAKYRPTAPGAEIPHLTVKGRDGKAYTRPAVRNAEPLGPTGAGRIQTRAEYEADAAQNTPPREEEAPGTDAGAPRPEAADGENGPDRAGADPVVPAPSAAAPGRPIPPAVAAAFARRWEITALMEQVSAVRLTVEKAVDAGDSLFANVALSQFQADCGNVYRALRFARPYAVCPYCAGDGCRACRSLGWVGQDVYDAAPADLKPAQK